MWLWSEISNGFSSNVDVARIDILRSLVALAILFKTTVSIFWGDWNLLSRDTLTKHRLTLRKGAWGSQVVSALHKPNLIIREGCCIALLFDVRTTWAALACACALLLELSWRYRYNTIFLILVALIIALLPETDDVARTRGAISGATFGMALLLVLTTSLYVGGAVEKLRSRDFTNGSVLRNLGVGLSVLGSQLSRWEFIPLPRNMNVQIMRAPAKLWTALARLVICLELLLPGLLLSAHVFPAVLIGIVLHSAFAYLMPLQLIPFQLATLATYVAFLPLELKV
jgi:hypothetical protein